VIYAQRGANMTIKVDTYSFDHVVACFWQLDGKVWEGVLNDKVDVSRLKILQNEKTIIFYRDFAEPGTVSNENNQLPL
jgi:hypothetical protein